MFNNLPGVIVNTIDGGLAVRRAPQAHSTLIVGTAGKGVADQPYQVVDPAKTALEFGYDGNLIRACEEARAASCDNIILFRMGTKPATLTAVGKDTTEGAATAGFDLSFGTRSSDTSTRYKIWYKTGVLAVYLDGILVFSNQDGLAVDTGDVTVTGLVAGNQGLQLGSGSTPSLATAVALNALPNGTSTDPKPVYTDAVTGLESANQTGRKLFIAALKAMDLLDGMQVEQLVMPDAKIDQPNIAFKVDSNDVVNDPTVNGDAFDFLKTTIDGYGNKTYQWAHETVDSEGATVTAAGPFANPAARVTAGYHEVNWGYAMARFAAKVSKLANQCIAFIGTTAPKTYKLADVRKWVGFLPTFGIGAVPTTDGIGLCGIPYLMGCTQAKLHVACFDKATGRSAGLFETAEGEYDGTVSSDIGGNPIDIGAYLHVVADQAIMSNGWGRNYAANLAAHVAGFCSMLDEKSALTNKALKVIQIPGLVYIPSQLDSLTFAKVNVLRSKGTGASPALLHDMSAATNASDYTTLLHTRVKGRFVQTLLKVADPFIGESSLDGLQLQSLKTALDQALVELVKRGYGTNPQVVVSATPGEARLGHATLTLTFKPADELIQLTAEIGLVQ